MSPRMMIAALTLMAATAPAMAQTQTQTQDKATAPKAEANFAPSAAIPQSGPPASARTSSTARATESEPGAASAPRAANEMK